MNILFLIILTILSLLMFLIIVYSLIKSPNSIKSKHNVLKYFILALSLYGVVHFSNIYKNEMKEKLFKDNQVYGFYIDEVKIYNISKTTKKLNFITKNGKSYEVKDFYLGNINPNKKIVAYKRIIRNEDKSNIFTKNLDFPKYFYELKNEK